jgi:hypothetical protein
MANTQPAQQSDPTQSTTSSDPQAQEVCLVATSIPLYGILVTEKSFLLGRRSQVLQHQGLRLAHRIIGDRLPTELCDEIGGELAKLLVKDTAQLWKAMEDRRLSRWIKFQRGATAAFVGGSEMLGLRDYNRMSRCETPEGVVRVRDQNVLVDSVGDVEEKGAEERYVHLSAALVRPSISMLVPNVAKLSGGPVLTLANGAMKVGNIPDGPTQLSEEYVGVRWRSGEPQYGAKRLVQFDDVEESIRAWNKGLIERLVEGMGLRVVNVRGVEGTGGGMKPEFRLWQQLCWG